MAFGPTSHWTRTTHSTESTWSTARVNTLIATCTSIPARVTRRWCDGGCRPIDASRKTHPTPERYSSGNVSAVNPATKRSKPSSKLRYDATNNPLPMSATDSATSRMSDSSITPSTMRRPIGRFIPTTLPSRIWKHMQGRRAG
jgi:hypothetical protein